MPNVVKVEVKGVQELQKRIERKLRRLEIRLQKESLRKAGDVVTREVKRGAPRSLDAGQHLADHVEGRIRVRGDTATYDVTVPGPFFYWRFLEFGTVKMAAQPFIRPAADRMLPQALEIWRSEIENELQRIEG